jgi:hypothetical protein
MIAGIDPRIVLRKLIERHGEEAAIMRREESLIIEEDVGSDGFGVDQATASRRRAGKLHLLEAVDEALAALASEDPERIAAAALICSTLERTGRTLERRHIRQKGGRTRGQQQTEQAASDYRWYTDRFRKLLAEHVPALKARRQVVVRMVRDGVPIPSAPTLRKLFPHKRSVKSSLADFHKSLENQHN